MDSKKTLRYFNAIRTGELTPAKEDDLFFGTVVEAFEGEKDNIDKPELLTLTYNQHQLLKQYMEKPSDHIAEIITLVYWVQDVDDRDSAEMVGRLNFDYELFEQQMEYWLDKDFIEAYEKFMGVLLMYGEVIDTFNKRLKDFEIPLEPQAIAAGIERLSEFSDIDEMNTIMELTGLNINQIGDLPYGLCLRIILRSKALSQYEYKYNKNSSK